MNDDKQEPLLSWIYYNDGTPNPQPLPKPEPPQGLKEPPKYDYDKLIEESTGLYRMW